jgi:SAM-dependent methyltransferase
MVDLSRGKPAVARSGILILPARADRIGRMDWSRIGRLWSFPGRNLSARSRWEYIGRSRTDAFQMMDGSTSEEDLRQRGGRMALAFSSALEIRPSDIVLDVGCGVARVGRELASLCGAYTGADISRTLLRRARERTGHLGNVRFVHLAGMDLAELPDARFSRLVCHLVFLHLDEPEIRALLRDFRRVLTPGGVAYFDAWNLRDSDVWDLFRRESLDHHVRRQPHRSRFYTREAVEDWLDACGLRSLWMSDDSFLVQAVVGRDDGERSAHESVSRRLRQEASRIIPRGKLGFPEADEGEPSTTAGGVDPVA